MSCSNISYFQTGAWSYSVKSTHPYPTNVGIIVSTSGEVKSCKNPQIKIIVSKPDVVDFGNGKTRTNEPYLCIWDTVRDNVSNYFLLIKKLNKF